MKRFAGFFITGVLLVLLFIMLNLLVTWLLGRYPIDATSTKRYTLDKSSYAAIARLQQPVTLSLYVSDNLTDYDWDLGSYAAEVAGLLTKYQLSAPEKIRLEIRRVVPFSEMERQALQDGILPLTVDERDFYFGLKVTAAGGENVVIPSLIAERRQMLENDLSRIFYNLTAAKKTIVGVVSPQMPLTAENNQKQRALASRLGDFYNLVELSAINGYIPLDVAVLLVINPQQLTPVFAYAVDQYVMRGGRVIFFVDPYSEIQHSRQGYPPKPDVAMEGFLREWGIIYHSEQIVGDITRSEKVKDADGRRRTYPLWFFSDGVEANSLHFRTPGSLEAIDNSGLSYEILASTSSQGGVIQASEVRYTPKSEVILAYQQDNQSRTLAMMAKGKFRSHYRNNILAGTLSADKAFPYLPFSTSEAVVAVVADSDFLNDSSWAAAYHPDNPVYGTVDYAENADFLARLIDRLSENMVGLPSKTKKLSTNIAEIFYIKSYERYADEREKLEAAEIDSAARLQRLLNTGAGVENVRYRKELNRAKQENRRDVRALQKINRQIAVTADQSLYNFIWLNLVIFPALFIGIIALIVSLRRRFKQQQTRFLGEYE